MQWLFAVAFLAAAPARAQTVILLPVAIDDSLAAPLSLRVDALIQEDLMARSGVAIVTPRDLDAPCAMVDCAVPLAARIEADRILAGSMVARGAEILLVLRWLDAEGNVLTLAEERSSENLLGHATHRALAMLLDGAAPSTAGGAPAFWAVEASLASGTRLGAEPYDGGVGATVRLAAGGRSSDSPLFGHVVIGLGLARFWGDSRGSGGLVSYGRTDVDPFFDLRGAVALGDAVRLFATLGAGLDFGWHSAEQESGLKTHGRATFGELRLGGGLWYRFSEQQSAFAGYRFRRLYGGEGADSASETVALGSTTRAWHLHEIELGAAVHF
jgi:hypothetical protein